MLDCWENGLKEHRVSHRFRRFRLECPGKLWIARRSEWSGALLGSIPHSARVRSTEAACGPGSEPRAGQPNRQDDCRRSRTRESAFTRVLSSERRVRGDPGASRVSGHRDSATGRTAFGPAADLFIRPQEKVRKVLDIWTKAGTFSAISLARISNKLLASNSESAAPAPAPVVAPAPVTGKLLLTHPPRPNSD